jgi:hypothetical protein
MNNVTENLNKEDIEFRRVLGSLEKIDAPDEFGFQVRAKISKAKQTGQRNGLWTFLRVAFPIALLLFGGVFVYKNYLSPNNLIATNLEKNPDVAKLEDTYSKLPETNQPENQLVLPDILNNSRENNASKNSSPNKPVDLDKGLPKIEFSKKDLPVRAIPSKTREKAKIELGENTIMTRDSASTDVGQTLKPKGFNQNKQVEYQTPNTGKANIEITEVWKVLGIVAEESEGKWYVKNVQKTSLAERSGLRVDDIIQSFDDKKILPKDIRVKSFSGKFLTIIREGKAVELTLRY